MAPKRIRTATYKTKKNEKAKLKRRIRKLARNPPSQLFTNISNTDSNSESDGILTDDCTESSHDSSEFSDNSNTGNNVNVPANVVENPLIPDNAAINGNIPDNAVINENIAENPLIPDNAAINENDDLNVDLQELNLIESPAHDYSTTDSDDSTDTDFDDVDNSKITNSRQLQKVIQKCAILNGFKQIQTTNLLKQLKRIVGFEDLPATARTLLQTPRNTELMPLANGSYYHFGVLMHVTDDTKTLQVFIDGYCPYENSPRKFWIIMGRCRNARFECIKSTPFVIGIFQGVGMPKSKSDFLRSLIEDLKNDKFISVDGEQQSVRIQILADEQARAYLKCITTAAGYSGCEYCYVVGIKVGGTMTYPDPLWNAPKRTNELFRNRKNENLKLLWEENGLQFPVDVALRNIHVKKDRHNKEKEISPFEELENLDMIRDFILDVMHMRDIGSDKRITDCWKGTTKSKVRLSADLLEKMSNRMIEFKPFIPSDFHRVLRPINASGTPKATERSQHAKCLGFPLSHGIVSRVVDYNFRCFQLGVRILSDRHSTDENIDYAEDLLRFFVTEAEKIYGDNFVVYNIHSLTHLPEIRKREKQPLEALSCYPFESHINKLNRYVQGSKNPQAEVVNRITEASILNSEIEEPNVILGCVGAMGIFLGDETIGRGTQYKKYCFDSYFFQVTEAQIRDNVALLEANNKKKILLIDNIVQVLEGPVWFIGRLFTGIGSLFSDGQYAGGHYPTDSTNFNIFAAANISTATSYHRMETIVAKCMCLPMPTCDDDCYCNTHLDKTYAIYTLLHSIIDYDTEQEVPDDIS